MPRVRRACSHDWSKVAYRGVPIWDSTPDHPFHIPHEHALNLDFVNESLGLDARVAVELSADDARQLVKTILEVLEQAEAGGHLE